MLATDINIAKRHITLPYSSSEEEKVRAIRTLANQDSHESCEVLIKAFYMVRKPMSAQKGLPPEASLPGGVITNSAAAALCASRNKKGLDFLCKIALTPNLDSTLREVALRHIAKRPEQEVVDVLEQLLQEEDERLVLISVQSSITLLKKCKDIEEAPVLDGMLASLFSLAFAAESKHQFGTDVITTAYGAFVSNASEASIDFIVRTLKTQKGNKSGRELLQALIETHTPFTEGALAELLECRLQDPSWYTAIGKRLAGTRNPEVVKIAKNVLEHQNPLEVLKASMVPSFRRSMILQRKAAKAIMQ